MSVTVVGGEALQRRLRAIENARPVLREIQLRAVREAKLRVPRKTGHLGRSIHPGDLTDTYTIIEASAHYAAYVERGTRPHVIRPRLAGVLAWPAGNARLSGRARVGGEMVFARFVRHPGTKPQPYMLPGAIEAIHQVGAKPIVDAWNDAA